MRIPLDLFNAAESEAEDKGPDAHALFLAWDTFCDWCRANLYVADHEQHAKLALQSLKQTSSVAAYKAAFDTLKAQAKIPGMHLFWWNQGLKPFIQTATAIDFRTAGPFTNLADTQSAALAVESSKMGGAATPSSSPSSSSQPSSSSRPFSSSDNRENKDKFQQRQPPQQQSCPAASTPFDKCGVASAFHKPSPGMPKNFVAYMRNRARGSTAAVIPEAIAKAPTEGRPSHCRVKGCNAHPGRDHSRWQDCPCPELGSAPTLDIYTR